MSKDAMRAMTATARAFSQFNAVRDSRNPSNSKVSTVTLDAGSNAQNVLLQEGSMTIVYAKKSSGIVSKLKEAVEKKDVGTAHQMLFDLLDKQMRYLLHPPASFAVENIDSATELRYMGRSIAEYFMPGDAFVTTMAYNGGQMDAGKFEVIEHKKDDSAPETETLLIFNQPHLSKLEKDILQKTRLEDSANNLDPDPPEWCTTTTVGVAAVAAMLYAGWDMMTQAAHCASERLSKRDINKFVELGKEGHLEKLDPRSAAKELVKVRAKIISDNLQMLPE